MVELFNKYDSESIKSAYKDIIYKCTPTNGQLKGRLPKLYELKEILDGAKVKKLILSVTKVTMQWYVHTVDQHTH